MPCACDGAFYKCGVRALMLTISKKLYEEIIAHCKREHPKEACGILAGNSGMVEQIYPMKNVENSHIGYAMDPKEQLSVEKKMRACKLRMVGIYHSHTASEAYPSSVDVSLAVSADVSYMLISLKDHGSPVAKSFSIDGLKITEETIEIRSE